MSTQTIRSREGLARVPRRIQIAAVAALATSVAWLGNAIASEQSMADEAPAAEQSQSRGVPDRVVLTPTDEPATSQSVTWRTRAGSPTPQVQWAEPTDGPSFVESVTTAEADHSTELQADLGYTSQFNTATMTGLTPDTTYLYRVGDGNVWSEWFEFTTAADGQQDFSFIYYGDAQNDVKEHVSRVFRQAFRDRPEAEILLHAGDLVNRANADAEWDEWFGTAGWINGMKNIIATPGNHEYTSGQLSTVWRPQFEFPDNGPGLKRLQETVYYVDYQGVRFISLDSNQQGLITLNTQAEWLEEVLANNPNKWTVVTFHHPVFSVSEGRDNAQLRRALLPILEEHNVDLVLNGHDHSYGRGNLDSAEGGSIREHNGTVYVVSVSGPKMYDVSGEVWDNNDAFLRHTAQDTQLYQLIDVTADTITYEARMADGRYHDGFVMTKDDDGNRTVVENEDPTRPPHDEPDEPDDPEPPEYTWEHEVTGSLSAITEGELRGAAYDADAGELYVGDADAPRVFVVDVASDALVREIETSAVVHDVTLDATNNELYTAESGGAVGVYSTEDGEAVRGPFEMSGSIRGVEISPELGYGVTTHLDAALEIFALDTGEIDSGFRIEGATRGVAFDPVNQLIWVAINAETDGDVGLHAYNLQGARVREVATDRNADDVAVDPSTGLVYVAHSARTSGDAGITVVHAATGFVVERRPDDAYGQDLHGLTTDPEQGRVFAVSGSRTPSAVTIIERREATTG